MALIHPEIGIALVAAFIRENKRANARDVRLEGEHEHVAHQAQVLGVILGRACGCDHA